MRSRRVTLPLVVVTALAAFLLLSGFVRPGSPRRAAADPVLTGDVGLNDAFVISLVDASGARVTHLEPGTYTIVVHDRSEMHNFHLQGPGVNVSTGITDAGDVTWSVTFRDGNYTFVCDPHDTVMRGAFSVGNAPPPTTTTTTTPKPKPKPAAKVAAHVGPGAKIGVGGAGGLTPGRAVVTVKDVSSADNFHLVGPGLNKRTGVAFKGTVRWSVTLKAGKYTFRSDAHPSLHGSFRVRAGASASSGSGYGPSGGYR